MTAPRPTGAPHTRTTALPVVGIGASAGGLKALQQFVEAVPADSGMAFVVIMHLDPERESRMSDLLRDRAKIPVTQVTGPMTVESNHIYMIPPGQDLTMRGAALELRNRGEHADHAPVDLFFRTLGEACGPDAVGVVLSGTGSDGTAGIRYIREAGGITAAQLPEEASYDGMPASAISTGLIDLVLPSAAIPDELIRLRHGPHGLGAGAAGPAVSETELAGVFDVLRSRTGHDFSMYRRSTVLRRLERRLRFNNLSTLEQYLPLLGESAAESRALLRDLLISVSSFFRDPDAFEALTALMPTLFEGKGAGDTVRVWVVGCATGEEVYSIAIVMAEYAATLADAPRLQLFATDIDEQGYAWARAGLYSTAAVAGIDPARLGKYFTREANGFRIAKSLRELVLFAGHNVLHDPPFSRMDLISCRNFFIYLQPEAQERVLETFHFATNADGLLFLGASESAGDSGLFTAVAGGGQRLFRRNAAPPRLLARLSAADPQPGMTGAVPAAADPPGQSRARFSYGPLHVRMLEQYVPASIIVNEHLETVHLSPGAGRFLRQGGGEPTHNVLMMASGEMRNVLRTALYHAFHGGVATARQVRTEVDGEPCDVRVQVRPGNGDGGADRFALILFETARRADPASLLHRDDRTVAELQTMNEELQSINGEQRAAAEELETGREQIQSINEELTTINQEHQSTIEELKRTNDDLQNLIESTEIGTIFLDRTMRIRRYTPAARALFNFVSADQGRPLSHITHGLRYDGLLTDVAGVLSSLDRVEREVESDTGHCYIMRINPYRSLDGTNEGAVLTFFDNTAQHGAREELRKAKRAIDEILSFAKLDGGHEVVEAGAMDARALATDAGSLIQPAATVKALAFVVDVPEDAVPIVTDAGKARQILINLCGNAVKYTDSGEVRLRMRPDDGGVSFEVRDTGVGIAAEHLTRVFDRFWQVDGASTRASGGMGIGLAAAWEYAQLLRGNIRVASTLGEGTSFTLWLPAEYERR